MLRLFIALMVCLIPTGANARASGMAQGGGKFRPNMFGMR